MLVLTRRSQEAVVIGGSAGFERFFKVIVLEIERGNVKLGFEVDPEVPVPSSVMPGCQPNEPKGTGTGLFY